MSCYRKELCGYKGLRECEWLLREILIQYVELLQSLWCLSVDATADTTIPHKGHAPLRLLDARNKSVLVFLVFLSVCFK